MRFQLSPNGLYYFDVVDMENGVLLLNTVSENWGGFTRRYYKGPAEGVQAVPRGVASDALAGVPVRAVL